MGNREWLAPLTGVLFVALVIVGFIVGGEPPSADDPAQEIVDFYVDNKDSVMIGAGLIGIAATLFVFFGGYLRKVLRAAEGEGGVLSAVSFAGVIIFAAGVAIDATLSFGMAESAEDIDPVGVQTIQAIWDNDFVPFAVGLQVFLLSTGISVVRHGALPQWLGWIAIVLGVIAATPIGFAAFMGSAVWVLIVSVMLAMRARGPAAPAPTA